MTNHTDTDELKQHLTNPETIKRAAEVSMKKRQELIDRVSNDMYYIGNKVFMTVTVEVLGKRQELPVKDIGNGIIGIVYVYDNEESAEKDNGAGYTKAVKELSNE